jgi:pilus assembly protein CpaB
MSARSILLIAAALVLVVGTVFVARAWLDSQRTQVASDVVPQEKDDAARVLVAEIDLPAGTFIKEEHLRWQPWPGGKLPETYLVQKETDPDRDLYGAVIRRGIAAGEPITRSRIIKPGERGFMAAVLLPGYRAMSIKVGAASGVSGLIFPGDRVDIILTHTLAKEDDVDHRASETIFENVRILALDRRVDDENAQAKFAKTATLELLPKQVELLTVAQELGRMSLALRPLAKDEAELQRLANGGEPLAEPKPTPGRTFTWDSEASVLVRWPKSNENVVSVVRGGQSQQLTLGKMFDQMMMQMGQQQGQQQQPATATEQSQ